MASLSHRLYSGDLSYEFIGKRRRSYLISAVIVLVCLGALLIRGLSLGIEFSGGTDFQVPMAASDQTVETVRQELQGAEVEDLDPQVFAVGDDTIRVQTRALSPEETTTVRGLIAEMADASPEDVTYTAIGPSWGQQVSQQALVALLVFVALVMVLIAVWFRDWRMSLAAVIPLTHDLIVTIGVYALLGFTVTPATMIGVLTILGYSLYDTVVVFDQIRHNTADLDRSTRTYGSLVNRAVNQVIVRSINTTVIGILPVSALLVAGLWLGGGPLGDLGLALFVGMIAGAYSSIFLAAPLLVEFNSRLERFRSHDERVAAGAPEAGSAPVEEPARVGGATAAPLVQARRQQAAPRLSRAERKQRNAGH